ncbi:MAG: maleylpyruvate isomerase family mycothiol-dependent enzyme [Acidimicrobiia bacterium]|nr:maleylpyruvate isomerase family mycothiol-dependent enzyme [Acidimicrobiia bacterium]MDH4363389.1 maleylpyruvate isomerase family mycothiol-dependent enzyme [Acidimicrobiia bacterium]MDH5290563.1 maleylpyruvate isomerase family mycothiol-dependent enzyme [Acidimicrobiia bacterium]
MTGALDEILTDLRAEYGRLDAMLAPLTAAQWAQPSAAEGWTIADVVAHLALTEEAVVRSAAERGGGLTARAGDLEADVAGDVTAAGLDGPAALVRWQTATAASVPALAAADPDRPLRWAAAPLKPRTLATTRLAEHWAHGLDLAGPLGADFTDTARLRHIAWLGHATLPYAFSLAGLDPVPVRAELVGPHGEAWAFGPPDAAARITGPAGHFCRVGAHRLAPPDSDLVADGPGAADALRLLRNWAA